MTYVDNIFFTSICKKCNFLSLEESIECPNCNSKMEIINKTEKQVLDSRIYGFMTLFGRSPLVYQWRYQIQKMFIPLINEDPKRDMAAFIMENLEREDLFQEVLMSITKFLNRNVLRLFEHQKRSHKRILNSMSAFYLNQSREWSDLSMKFTDIIEKIGEYHINKKEVEKKGKEYILACDARCDKAWGSGGIPEDRKEYEKYIDAPFNPGSKVGRHTKPNCYANIEKMNCWCLYECERSKVFDIGEKIELPHLKGKENK